MSELNCGPVNIEELRGEARDARGLRIGTLGLQAADEIERLRDLIDRFGDWNVQKALEASDELQAK